MSDENELKQLWQAQPAHTLLLEPQQLRQQAAAFQRQISWRNRIEYGAGGLVMAVFAAYLWLFPFWLTRLGSLLVILGTVVMMWQLHRRTSAQALPAEAWGLAGLQFHRQQLLRQRDALRSVWLWYVGPFVPGLLVFGWGRALEMGNAAPPPWLVHGFTLLVLLAVVGINQWAARRLQRQIDDLDRLNDEKET